MKKKYIKPVSETVRLHTNSDVMLPYSKVTDMINDTEEINSTIEAESKGFGLWEDDDEDWD